MLCGYHVAIPLLWRDKGTVLWKVLEARGEERDGEVEP